MLSRLFRSLDVLLRQKQSLTAKTHQLAQAERRLIDKLSGALAGAGYRVVPRAGGKTVARSVKRLRCPECARTFAHPLPMARHLKATHHSKKTPKKPTARRRRKTSA
jgi:ribosomal protein L44E